MVAIMCNIIPPECLALNPRVANKQAEGHNDGEHQVGDQEEAVKDGGHHVPLLDVPHLARLYPGGSVAFRLHLGEFLSATPAEVGVWSVGHAQEASEYVQHHLAREI